MKSVKLLLVFLFLTPLVEADDLQPDDYAGPFFWDTKKEIRRQIDEEKYVAVSVVKDEEKTQPIWWMKGAGIVQSPADFSFQYATDFEKLKRMKDSFSLVEWNPSSGLLTLRVKFPLKEINLKFHVQILGKENPKKILYSVVEGPFNQSEGVILFRSAKQQLTEVSVIGRYRGDLPLKPDFLVAFAVEGMMHHVATSLRSNIEAEWKGVRSSAK